MAPPGSRWTRTAIPRSKAYQLVLRARPYYQPLRRTFGRGSAREARAPPDAAGGNRRLVVSRSGGDGGEHSYGV